jgi:hypothetical protein
MVTTVGKVRVICTDAYHAGTKEWAAQDHHYLDTALLGYDDSGSPCIAPRTDGVLRIQPFRRADGVKSFEARCKCGRTYRALEPRLIADVARTWDGDTRRAVLDIAAEDANI